MITPRKLAELAMDQNSKYKEGLIRAVELAVTIRDAADKLINQEVANAESILRMARGEKK